MSGQAMHRVLVDGPHHNQTLMLVLLNVADWPDTDLDGRGHIVPQQPVAARSGISLRYCRKLMDQAVQDGWLEAVRRTRQGSPGLWKLGPNFAPTSRNQREVLSKTYRASAKNFVKMSVASAIDGDVVDVTRTRTREGGRRALAQDETPSPHVAPHPPSCACDGSGWLEDQNGIRSVRRCPGPERTTAVDDGRSPP